MLLQVALLKKNISLYIYDKDYTKIMKGYISDMDLVRFMTLLFMHKAKEGS